MFEGLFGKALRHVATLGQNWVALVGWQAVALKLAARDGWISWSPQRQSRRLRLLTQTPRFVIQDLQEMDFSACPPLETLTEQHDRIERLRDRVKNISAPEWDGHAALYGRKQAIRVERQRHQVEAGKTSTEVSDGLTSLEPAQATAEQLAALLRNHWEIENRLH